VTTIATVRQTLSEHESKVLLMEYGIPVTREIVAAKPRDAHRAADTIGYPVAVKGSGRALAHKTELGMVNLGLTHGAAVEEATARLLAHGAAEVLVQEMIHSDRPLLLGMIRDAQFGPCVSFGLGGTLAEALQDSSLRVAPFSRDDAHAMLRETLAWKVLHDFRGLADVDEQQLVDVLCALAEIGVRRTDILEIDVNPVLVTSTGSVVAVDGLVVLSGSGDMSNPPSDSPATGH